MTTAPIAGPHLTDGDVVRLLDREAEGVERSAAEAHLAHCEACRHRARLVERRATRFSALLADGDWGEPPALPIAAEAGASHHRYPAAPWFRRAAMVALLLGVGAVGGAMGARGVQRVTAWWGERARAHTAVEAPPNPEPAGAGDAVNRVRFTAAAEITVEVATRQAAGALIVETVEGAEVVVEEGQQDDPGGLLVLPGGVRIQNEPGSRADYRIQLPRTTRRLRIRIGDEVPVEWEGSGIGGGKRVELGRGRG